MQREDVGDPSGTSLHSVFLPQNAVEKRKCDLALCAAMALPSSIIVANRQLDVNCAMLCYKPDNQLVIITDYY